MKLSLKCRVVALFLIVVFCFCSCKGAEKKYTFTSFDYFDTVTTVIGYTNSKSESDAVFEKIKAGLEEYHKLYDIYNTYDGMVNLCSVNSSENKGKNPDTVNKKIVDLLSFCKQMYTQTNGKTNIAMGSVLSLWHNCRTSALQNPKKAHIPDMKDLSDASNHTNIDDLIIDKDKGTVFLTDKNMKLDVGAVAKGYATECIAKDLEAEGISGYILNIGGNVRAIGAKPNGEPFLVGIENPDKKNESEPYIAYVNLSDMSLVTSGSYQRYFTVNGKDYNHIIDPQTLMPSQYFLSVSVLCKDSGLADALSTALFSMDMESGKKLISSLPDVEALWVTRDNEKIYSDGFKSFLSK